jgi:hypothetical protein
MKQDELDMVRQEFTFIYIYIHTHTHTHTEGVSGGIVNILGGGSMDYSK